jgi:hypothetical protein
MNELDYILTNHVDFLKFLKAKLPLYHASNVFFRDLQYGVMSYVEDRMRKRLTYPTAEELARRVIAELEEKGILRRIDERTWTLNLPDFAMPRQAPTPKAIAAASKPAAASTQPTAG